MSKSIIEQAFSKVKKENRERVDKAKEMIGTYYNNDNGSLYKFAQDHNLNAWEFDLVKRIVRSRKKGQFREDMEKTKHLIDLYLKEYTP